MSQATLHQLIWIVYDPMRVLIIGLPGSGKTTFARAVSSNLKIPHLEVDQLFWKERPEDLWAAIRPFTDANDWIIEGHFSKLSSHVLPLVDRVIWLDYPLVVTLRRALSRALRELWDPQLTLNQRLRFLKLRHARKLNDLFDASFKEARRRGAICLRVTQASAHPNDLRRALMSD